jgi:hypothetical protein
VISEPPSLTGAVKLTVACAVPGLALTAVGASGGVAVMMLDEIVTEFGYDPTATFVPELNAPVF